MRSFTTNTEHDLPSNMTVEECMKAYAAWGRFIDLSRTFIVWHEFIDYSIPVDEVIQRNDDGSEVVEVTIKLRYLKEAVKVDS